MKNIIHKNFQNTKDLASMQSLINLGDVKAGTVFENVSFNIGGLTN